MSHRCIVREALESGKLQPCQRAWAEALCCRDRKSLEEYLRQTGTPPVKKPALYDSVTCAVCGEENVPGFSVLAEWRHGAFWKNGYVMVCIRCLTTGRWRNG